MRTLKILTAAAMAIVMFAAPVLAGGCGCSGTAITLAALSHAQRLAPAQAANARIIAAESNLQAFLAEYDYQFRQDYAAMSIDQRKAHYALLNDMRLKRIALVNTVQAAYAAAGAPQPVLDILAAHAAALDVKTPDAVATLRQAPALLQQAEASGDAVMLKAAAQFRDACEQLESNLATCINNAVAQSAPLSAGHLTQFAWVAGPANNLAARLAQLHTGAQPVTLG